MTGAILGTIIGVILGAVFVFAVGYATTLAEQRDDQERRFGGGEDE